MEPWLFELVRAIGRFFLHPVLYISIISIIFAGYWRVRQERKDFSIKIYNAMYELPTSLFAGITIGILLSVVLTGVGLVLPKMGLAAIALWTILFAITFQYRYLSAAYSVGIAMLLFLFPNVLTKVGEVVPFLTDVKGNYLPSLAILLALLLFTEGHFIMKYSSSSTPRLLKAKRGLLIGMHRSKRLWIVPLFVLIPGDGIQSFLSWWPVISVDTHTFSLFLIPFTIGFSIKVKGMLPSQSIMYTGRQVTLLSFLVLALAIASIWLPGLAVAAAGIAILGRISIAIREKIEDEKPIPYFSQKTNGLIILDILPNSVGIEMGLRVGEIITKVNGMNPTSLREFYSALQRNTAGAFCKMEVIDTNGELRLVQHAIYAGDHHELGIVFVQRETDWGIEVG
ncbi:PDZ domain-containing protein [Ectobacillus sp. sgz5001026]|uniref:PDZ domain-containing protein n=1 Tax=Ectobacillus sp. sgz5001026 TaxID=3242473 RepID=UPI0036D2844B